MVLVVRKSCELIKVDCRVRIFEVFIIANKIIIKSEKNFYFIYYTYYKFVSTFL